MTPRPQDRERRTAAGKVELRAAPEGSKSPGTLVGYAAVFDAVSCDLGGFVERIAPGAFRACLQDDVRALANHHDAAILGRSTAGTLRFEEDGVGLRYEVDLPDTSHGRDTAESVRRGDVTGSSFQFVCTDDEWEWPALAGPVMRTVRTVSRLYDVGPVTFPAYEAATVSCRSFEAARERAEAERRAAVESHLALAKARLALAEAELI